MALKWPNDLVAGDAKLGGILAELRAEAGGPAFVVLGIGHLVLATLVYVAAAAICHRRAAPTAPMARPAPYDWRDGPGLRDRFNRLDARLAAMEAEAAHNEAALRRAFRDLDSK